MGIGATSDTASKSTMKLNVIGGAGVGAFEVTVTEELRNRVVERLRRRYRQRKRGGNLWVQVPILLVCMIVTSWHATAQSGAGDSAASAAAQQEVPAWVDRGLPGPKGTIAGVAYWRLGLLGYSTMDERYEWVTIDAANANMMIYLGQQGSGPQMPINMNGTFTDQGVIGEEIVGKAVGQRTVIRIENDNRHIVELYFTPPGGEEFLADRSVYAREQGQVQSGGPSDEDW